MNRSYYLLLYFLLAVNFAACSQNSKPDNHNTVNDIKENSAFNELSPEEERVIIHKGTEAPYTGKYYLNTESGTYICKRCNAPLYLSDDKFEAHCGWPSFDAEIKGAVDRVPDADGRRTEIVCTNCKAHLGHVFEGEGYTDKNIRHCVNSISMEFIPKGEQVKSKVETDTAFFASGCFWGTEFYFQKAPGVISVTSGFSGGHVKNPSYKEVTTGRTGHAETVQVIFDPAKTNYEDLVRLFFETHDPGQENGQGPDIGPQYRSAIFYKNEEEKLIAEKMIKILKDKNYKVVTEVTEASDFYRAEDYHQDYYANSGGTPYCHKYEKKF